MTWYLQALRKYAVFRGRARRKEYWLYGLWVFLLYLVLLVVDVMIGTYVDEAAVGLISTLFVLAHALPSLAVTVRRLHDTDRSGWWVLLGLIPIIGSLILLIFTLQDGTPGANRYGPDPKGRGT
ncbi:DUF805 domain-containing protein [Rhodothermaceae bacterium RA]|nr:DUF805 domain-containing protein [Rhodothermaceae bacterium RA]